jgi:acyl-coenzyme A thioesterase PaaI-like protein
MLTLGVTLGNVTSTQVEIVRVPKPEVPQQHGFVHAGAISGIADRGAKRTLNEPRLIYEYTPLA